MNRLFLSLVSGFAVSLGGAAFAQETPSVASIVEGWTKSAHADASAEAFTHWNDEGHVPGTCALCHAGSGFRANYGFDGSPVGEVPDQPIGGVIDCDTCHEKSALRTITEVKFPSGVMISTPEAVGTCSTCHQGRQSGPSVAAKTQGMDADTVNAELSFQNPHYAAAAATLNGSVAMGGFQYEGHDYVGINDHAPGAATCTDCHDAHSLKVDVESCATCHRDTDPKAIRIQTADYDGDGDTSEGIAGEIATLHAALGEAIVKYAAETAGAPVVYAASSYPYFFNDGNANGTVDEGEAVFPNRYASWTPRLLHAAYNYQFAAKDPGGYAHNAQYIIQILMDSIQDITGSGTVSVLRP